MNQERIYFFRSKRHFKSKAIQDRKSASVKGLQRRKSSVITVFQDDNTIVLFKEIETYLVAKHDVKQYWNSFFKNINECQEAIRVEQLVRRWVLVYVYGDRKKLSKTTRFKVNSEKIKVLDFISSKMKMEEFYDQKLTLRSKNSSREVLNNWTIVSEAEYKKYKSSFHYCCFILSMMETVRENSYFSSKFSLKLSNPPWSEIEVKIFLDQFPWPSIKENLVFYFKGLESYLEELRDKVLLTSSTSNLLTSNIL